MPNYTCIFIAVFLTIALAALKAMANNWYLEWKPVMDRLLPPMDLYTCVRMSVFLYVFVCVPVYNWIATLNPARAQQEAAGVENELDPLLENSDEVEIKQ
ncbi:hypothetical protein DdX_11267 [Ditylenchus destructor]|uniref:Uncharacterized protein n=1 Tax=Ditylenchus destructor TaxID=166010 RepID=A0AAD4N124_9BILA|nr:hypothetical protein DdX_11267 [Ditylenchus destructor]